MKLETMKKITEAMKEIAPVIEKNGYTIVGIEDKFFAGQEFISINIDPQPESGKTVVSMDGVSESF